MLSMARPSTRHHHKLSALQPHAHGRSCLPVCELRNASLMLGRLIGTHQERFDGSKPTPHYLGYGRHDGALASEPVYDDGLVHVNCRSLCCSGLIHLKAP